MGRRDPTYAQRFFFTEAYVHGYKQIFEVAMSQSSKSDQKVQKNTPWIWDHLAQTNPIHAAVSAKDEREEEKKTKNTLKLLIKELNDGVILDLGCGYGRIAKYLLPHRRFAGYIGIDRSMTMLKIFLDRHMDKVQEKETALLLAVSFIDNEPLRDDSVDNVIVSAVFLHNHKDVTKYAPSAV